MNLKLAMRSTRVKLICGSLKDNCIKRAREKKVFVEKTTPRPRYKSNEKKSRTFAETNRIVIQNAIDDSSMTYTQTKPGMLILLSKIT